jgi:hypothetical protein
MQPLGTASQPPWRRTGVRAWYATLAVLIRESMVRPGECPQAPGKPHPPDALIAL